MKAKKQIKSGEIKKGDMITLMAKSNHGKNRINQHGDKWIVSCILSHEVLLRSAGETFVLNGKKSKDFRRVSIENDSDFCILGKVS